MGCDIHIAIEVQNRDGIWRDKNAYSVNPYFGDDEYETQQFHRIDPYRGRNYELFTAFAGVRSRGHEVDPIAEPRGIPTDVSEFIKKDFERWGCDAHTPSYLTLKEILDWGEVNKKVKRSGMVSPETLKELRENGTPPSSWCGWTSDESWEHAEWEDELKIIDWFVEEVKKYLEGNMWSFEVKEIFDNPESTRFVFWFDN